MYKARQMGLDRVVAVKVLSGLVLEPEKQKRFQNEARVLAGFDHPNIVKNLSYGVSKDGQAYIVMEFLEGKSLSDELSENGRLSLQKFRDIFLPLLSALSFAHDQGLVHRDIKPGNIMLLNNGQVKLVDFGIAKVFAEDEPEAQHLTATGALLGSPNYMSPEQCTGKKVDWRSDIYSISCVMYESLCGEPIFSGGSPLEVMQKHTSSPLPSTVELSRKIDLRKELIDLILSGLNKEPEKRIQSASELANKLKSLLDNTTLSKVPRLKDGMTVPKGLSVRVAFSLLVFLLLISAAFFFSVKRSREQSLAQSIRPSPDNIFRQGLNLDSDARYEQAFEKFESVLALLQDKTAGHGSVILQAHYRAASCANSLMEDRDPEKIKRWFEPALSHSSQALEYSKKESDRGERTALLLQRAAILAKGKNAREEILALLASGEEILGKKSWEFFDLTEGCLEELQKLGEFGIAERKYLESLELARVYGRGSFQVYRVNACLALLYARQGMHEQAKSLAEKTAMDLINSVEPSVLPSRRLALLCKQILAVFEITKSPEPAKQIIQQEFNLNGTDIEREPARGAELYDWLARIYAAEGDEINAFSSYDHAINLLLKKPGEKYINKILKNAIAYSKQTKHKGKEKTYIKLQRQLAAS